MPAVIECSGEIEIICDTSRLQPGRQAKLVFRVWEDVTPPYQIKIWSPSGSLIVDRVIRNLPTGEPQSPSPVAFSVNVGAYVITMKQLRGTAEGNATLTVAD